MIEADHPTLIAICGGGHADHVDVSRLGATLSDWAPDASTEVVQDLCRGLGSLKTLVEESRADRVVLGLCMGATTADEIQISARRAGLDPFLVEAVDLQLSSRLGPETGSADRAAVALASTAAGLRAAPTTPATQLSARLAKEELSRRALLSLPVSYRAVAAVDQSACVGMERCGLCVAVCPPSAIRASEPYPSVDASTCVACGACVAACPARAVGLPGANLRQQEARIGTLLARVRQIDPAGLVIGCRGALGVLRDASSPKTWAGSWLPIPVPCLSSVTPAWILQMLAGGSPTVALLGCGDRCGTGSTERILPRIEFCRELLGSLGEDGSSSRVRLAAGGDLGFLSEPRAAPLPASDGSGALLVEPQGTADAVRRLARDQPVGPLQHAASPLGAVSIDVDGCTLCGVCAGRCPTGALTFRLEELATLSFDGARCLGCDHCRDACPERVVRTERRMDLPSLAGTRTVKQEAAMRCERCGRPVGPPSTIRRVLEMLPDASPELRSLLADRCSDCRGL